MNTNQFKKLIKENLSDDNGFMGFIKVIRSACESTQDINVCDMLSPDKIKKLIKAGEFLEIISVRQFSSQDIEYMTRLIAVAKREFGSDNQEVLDFERSIKDIMKIDGEISAAEETEMAMESLKEDFSKFKLD